MSDISISFSDTKVPNKITCNIQVNLEIEPNTFSQLPELAGKYGDLMPYIAIIFKKIKDRKYKSIEDLFEKFEKEE